MQHVFRLMSVGLLGLLGASCASAPNSSREGGEREERVGSQAQALEAQCTELNASVTAFACNIGVVGPRLSNSAANSAANAQFAGFQPENAFVSWDLNPPASTPGFASAYVNFQPSSSGDWAIYHASPDVMNVRVVNHFGVEIPQSLKNTIPTCSNMSAVSVFPLVGGTPYYVVGGPAPVTTPFQLTIVKVDDFNATFYADTDGDTYGNASSPLVTACKPPANYVATSNDCDDTKASTNPGAAELCDGIDNNCNGQVDEGIPVSTFYRDVDGDGFGDPALTISKCAPPPGYVTMGGDCNDANPAIHPGAADVCDFVDNNCNGAIDEGVEAATYYVDADGDGFGVTGSAVVSCVRPAGTVLVGGDCDDAHATAYPGGTEVCDGLDNNCNGTVDDGVLTEFYRDADGDGYGVATDVVRACAAPTGYAAAVGDCDDTRADVHPLATELCDGIDNDCNGVSDENVQSTYYRDADGDGFGADASTVTGCIAPGGYASVGGDCNDANALIHPGALEVCDGTDNNCNGQTDEGLTFSTYYPDADGDGYGVATGSIQSCRAVAGYAPLSGDCNDGNGEIKPGAAEVCDNVDNDCNGEVDDGIDTAYYFRDADGDGFGDTNDMIGACAKPDGYVTNASDCNDADAAIRPNAKEVCDGVDNNCNDQIDEGVSMTTYYRDADGDGYGSSAETRVACAPPEGYTAQGNDCNDKATAIHPGAAEVCDQVDNDCDGVVDAVGGVSVCTLPPVQVTAAKSYLPWRWTNGVTNLPAHSRIAIPAEIPVTKGNAGNDFAAFATFDHATGRAYACLYRGGSPVPFPKTAAQLRAGLSYKLLFCTGDKKAGDVISADQLYLSVNGYAFAGKTEVSFSVTPQLPE